MTTATTNGLGGTVVFVVGLLVLFYRYRKEVSQALTVAAEVMESYNDQYNHNLDDKDDHCGANAKRQ